MQHFLSTVSFTDVFNWIRAPFFILFALGSAYLWFKRRFWLPMYVHVLAAITFIGTWAAFRFCFPVQPPPSDWVNAAFALFFALIVYVVFVLYGGADAAWTNREEQIQKAIENAGVPKALLRQKAREAARTRCTERLHLGLGTAVPITAALVNAILCAILASGSLPLWGAVLLGIFLWSGATAFFLFTQTYSPIGIAWRYVAILVVLLGSWKEFR